MKFNIIQRVNPRDLAAPRKFYAVSNAVGNMDIRRVSKRIARETALSTSEVMATIESFIMVIPDLLIEGQTVTLGEFGAFRLNLSSEGTDTAEEFNINNIKGLRLNFAAGKEFKKVLKTVEFQRVPTTSS
ncbi:MAG: HU family DNA-binding protein [Bacteroidetes bacterium]|nr:HU family DNA-binding protein [Bacteroidota bacterium]